MAKPRGFRIIEISMIVFDDNEGIDPLLDDITKKIKTGQKYSEESFLNGDHYEYKVTHKNTKIKRKRK